VVSASTSPDRRLRARLNPLRRRVRTWRRDAALFLRIGWFIARAPVDMEKLDLPAFIESLGTGGRPSAADPWSGRWLIVRLRTIWLRLPYFRARNTCYVRALVLYRFLDPGPHHVGVHVGVEPPRAQGDRLRGHAWVTVDGEVLEGPPEVIAGRVREVRLHPVAR
jgi:hypothetical protein